MMINQYLSLPGEGRHQRTYLLSKFLSDNDYDVHLVGSKWHQLMYSDISQVNIESDLDDKLRITRIAAFKYVKASGLMRLISWLAFAFGLASYFIFSRVQRPDVVYYSSPSLFAALSSFIYARWIGAVYIFEIRDLWPLTFVKLANYSRRHPLIWLMFKLEKFLCSRSDLVVSNLQHVDLYLDENGIDYKKFFWLPNFTKPINKNTDSISFLDDNVAYFNIGYFGNIGHANNIEKLVFAIEKLNEKYNHNVKLHIYGDGENFNKVLRLVNERGVNNILIRPSIPKNKVFCLLQRMQAGIITFHDSDLYKYGTALNKFYDYLSCGLPVIYDVGTNGYDPVSFHDVGFAVDGGSEDDLADAMFEMSSLPVQRYEQLVSNTTSVFNSYYTLEVVGNKLLKLLRTV